MRSIRHVAVVFFCFTLVLSISAQQTTTQATQALAFLQSALAALAGANPVTDVTLSGTAHYIAGSDDETGTATLKAIVGASRIDLNLSSGTRSEIQNIVDAPVGTWSGPDGVAHTIADHNLLLIDPAWFFPAFPVSRGLSSGYVATYVGQETWNSLAVQHLSISQQPADTSDASMLEQHLSQVDLYLDASTYLPVAIDFNIHPDNDAGLDIPIEVRFLDYRSVDGAQVPFHIQRFLNNGLVLDLQFQTITFNSGLTASSFSL